jgi:NADPH-dependent 2,4-dienoyl-CoA reductase/sulfur reductase-like enzyme
MMFIRRSLDNIVYPNPNDKLVEQMQMHIQGGTMAHVVIVGAGLVGSMLTLYLARAGYQVSVYERLPDPRLVVAEFENRSPRKVVKG